MGFFASTWIVLIIGWLSHVFADRHRNRRTGARLIELALLWVLVGGGVSAIISGIGHVGPNSATVARNIGYAPSMFQWEVGWSDIAIGVLGVACAWRRLRGTWLTATVVALSITYTGEAIGHLMQLIAHDNRATDNVWALPGDLLSAVLAILLLLAYRRTTRQPTWT